MSSPLIETINRKMDNNFDVRKRPVIHKEHITPQSNDNRRPRNSVFEDYWGYSVVKVGLENGDVFKDTLRINAKNFEEAFVDDPENGDDVLLEGIKSRNRALHDDIVAYIINHKHKWLVKFQDLLISYPEFEKVYREYKVRKTLLNSAGTNDKACADSKEKAKPKLASNQSTERRKHAASNRNCLLQSLTEQGDISLNEREKTDDGKSEEDYQLISRASALNIDQPRTPSVSDLKGQHTSVTSSKVDFWDSDENTEAMRNVKLPLNITHEEMQDMASMLPACHVFDVDLTPFTIKTGKVVRILEMCHSRRCVGKIKLFTKPNIRNALFAPLDSKVPRLRVPLQECPKDFLKDPKQYENVLFAARIVDWKSDDNFAIGSLMKRISDPDSIKGEMEVLLIENGITWDSLFPPGVEQSCKEIIGFDNAADWEPSEKDLSSRRNYQGHAVFSIDPPTARDLDDALHCVKLDDGNFEVGVHIADVSHFVKESTPLDDEAAMRTTSTYMPHRVIPMLPRSLCEHVCSLQPEKARLAFSVVYKLSPAGEVMDCWIGKTVIRSRCQMSYDHAQKIIDEPDCTADDLPSVPGESFEDVKDAVIKLHLLAQALKQKRFKNGALKIQKKKIGFLLDPQSGQPGSFFHHRGMESHSLIEEFMLLANMTVAEKVYNKLSEFAFLRRHDSPKTNMLAKLEKECVLYDFKLEDGSTSGGIAECLDSLYETLKDTDPGKYMYLVELFSKKMVLAKYFCTGAHGSRPHSHYALNVLYYTHFTSPIRRYPDVIVHRQLYAALCSEDTTEQLSNASFNSSAFTEDQDPDFIYNIYCQTLSEERKEKQIKKLEEIAHHCNVNKLAAKRVSEGSIEVFFNHFVKDNGPIPLDGTVVAVLDRSVDVLLHDLHLIKRLYFDKQENVELSFVKHPSVPQKNQVLLKTSTGNEKTLALFTPLQVIASVDDKSSKLVLHFNL